MYLVLSIRTLKLRYSLSYWNLPINLSFLKLRPGKWEVEWGDEGEVLQAWLCPSWGCDFEHCCLPGFVSPASVKWRLGHMLFTALPGSTLKKHYSFLHAAEAWLAAHESAFYRKAVVWVPMLDTSEEKVHCKGASENKPLRQGWGLARYKILVTAVPDCWRHMIWFSLP